MIPRPPQTAPIHLYESTQLVARIVPDLPKGSPRNIALPMLEAYQARRFFAVDHGFVPVEKGAVPILKRVHCDGELTERGGRGPKLFEVCTAQEAATIIADEQRRVLLSNAGGSLLHAELKLLTDSHGSELTVRLEERLDQQHAEAERTKVELAAAVASTAKAEAETASMRARLATLEALVLGASAPQEETGEPSISNDLAVAVRGEKLRGEAGLAAPTTPALTTKPTRSTRRAPRATSTKKKAQ